MERGKMQNISFRPSDKALANINSVMKNRKINRTRAINYLCEQIQSEQQEGAALPSTQKPEAFDYEKWYCDCEFGTYFKDKKKVHCACGYPSIKKWLPEDRLVEPQVCDTCLPRIQNIKEFIKKKDEEKNALSHTGRYFTNADGTRIPY